MIRKLRVKFVAINMATVTVMLVIILSLVYNFTRTNLEVSSVNMMKTIASGPFGIGAPNEAPGELKLPYFSLQLGHNGEILSTSGGFYDLSDRELLTELINESLQSGRETGIIEKHALRFYHTQAPFGSVYVFADMSSENKTLSGLLRTCIAIGLFGLLGFLGISVLLARWAVRPVEKAWVQQKQFVADASHELKTPLTVITTNAELMQNPQHPAEAKEEFSKSILTMAQQMRHLVERLLELARSDTDARTPDMSVFDFSALVSTASISFEGVFADSGRALESFIEPDITVSGIPSSLQQIIGILLDNANKYSSPGSTTRLRLCSFGRSRCRLSVTSSGNPIPQTELESVFRRFYRMDGARSRDGSLGLGLSIAENIVLQHRGRIWAESSGENNIFTVELKRNT